MNNKKYSNKYAARVTNELLWTFLGCVYIAQGKHTCKGDVWAFAVTLWEILTFAREQPFEEFPDHRIVENATYFYQEDERRVSAREIILRHLPLVVSDVLNVTSTLSTWFCIVKLSSHFKRCYFVLQTFDYLTLWILTILVHLFIFIFLFIYFFFLRN